MRESEVEQQTRRSSWWCLPFGVLLPLVTLVFEWQTRICTDTLFDPLPTLGHVALVASVALALGLVFRASRTGSSWLESAPWLLGWSLALAAIYTLPFLPWLPVSVMAVVYYGFGFLPLSPLLAMLTAALMARRLSRDTRLGPGFGRRLTLGAALAVVVFLLVSSQMLITNIGLRMAESELAEQQLGAERDLAGIRLLRWFGDEDLMHQACFRTRPASSMLWTQHELEIDVARLIYYRVTGQAFTHRQPERLGMSNRWLWDVDQGGERVGQRVAGLSLSTSVLDLEIEPTPAVAYGEWLLRFDNAGTTTAEARAEIELPADGVVSRVTLWIDGEPREAAFGGRGQVRAAYESVVRRQRDPLLVTTSGPDRVLIQCFPIMPNGQMQIQLGITFPLQPASRGLARAHLPAIIDRNFSLREGLQHQLMGAASGPWRLLGSGEAGRAMAWSIGPSSRGRGIEVERDPRQGSFVVKDPIVSERYLRGELVTVTAKPLSMLAVVVDGSLAMAPWRQEVAALLEAVEQAGLTSRLYLASDSSKDEVLQPAADDDVVEWLLDQRFAGGQDPRAALARARRQLAPGGSVLWVTGPQPLRFDDRSLQWPEDVPIYAVMPEPGGHELWADFDAATFRVLRPTGVLASVVSELPAAAFEKRRWTWSEANDSETSGAAGVAVAAGSLDVARLWAKQRIEERLQVGETERSAALELAVQYRLVTPISGAVVLETAQQYEEAGLEPPAPEGIPTVPEPALIVLVSMVLMTCWWLRRGVVT